MIDNVRNRIIGSNVVKYREKMKITQTEMAERLGIPRPSYALIETGKRKLSATELFRLSLIMGVPIERYFDGAY